MFLVEIFYGAELFCCNGAVLYMVLLQGIQIEAVYLLEGEEVGKAGPIR